MLPVGIYCYHHEDYDLTQENASLRNSGGHSGQSAEKALYSTPKFWNISYNHDHDDSDDDHDDDNDDDHDDDNDDDRCSHFTNFQ